MEIKPSDIDTSRHFWGAFGNMEREVSARWIVRYCQQAGSWEGFTERQLQDFYNQERGKAGHAPEAFWFNGLDRPQWLQVSQQGRYCPTALFVALCHQAAPKAEATQ